MKRLIFVCALIAAAAFLAFRRPANVPPPSLTTLDAPVRPRHFRKGNSSGEAAAVVYVVGAVARPGLYRLNEGSRADDAVRLAGGFTPAADAASVNLAERIADGEEIHVLRIGETSTARSRSRSGGAARKPSRRSHPAPLGTIDLNSASADVLATLPGVGPILADRIVQYRELNGPFTSVDELLDVAGVTQRRADALAPYLRAGTP